MVTKKSQLEWLDKRRAAINEKIVSARQEDKGQYLPELQMVNALAESVGEMSAVEYLKAKAEMCDSDWNAASCNRCELRGSCEERGCAYFEQEHPFLSVEIVKRWKEEHDGND